LDANRSQSILPKYSGFEQYLFGCRDRNGQWETRLGNSPLMPSPWRPFLLGLTCMFALSGCEAPQRPAEVGGCPTGQSVPVAVFELFFGRSVPGGGEVSDQAWDDFLAQVVTPTLPNGYTVFDAVGAWRNPTSGRSVHERTKVLLVALPDASAGAAAVARIRSAYQVQFHQTLVGMIAAPACGSF
jgi:hypothetical protein